MKLFGQITSSYHVLQHRTWGRYIRKQHKLDLNFLFISQRFLASKNETKKEPEKPVSHESYVESITKSYVAQTLKEIESSLVKKYLRGYSRFQQRLAIAILCAIGVTGFSLYMFREPIKDNLSDEVADVASRSLGDESVVLKANEITRIVLNELVNDKNTQQIVSKFVTDILATPEVQKSVIDLVNYVINDESTRKELNLLVTYALKTLLSNEDTFRLLKDYIYVLLMSDDVRNSFQALLLNLARDDYTKQILADFFKQVLLSDTVTDQAIDLGKTVTDEIINDVKIQKDTGNALWKAGWYSITPRWFASK